MPCERAEQPLLRSALEDTGAPVPMEIMMAGSPEDICLLACSPQSPGIRDVPGAAPSREREPEPRGHVAAPDLPRAGNGSPSHGDACQPQICLELGAEARAMGTRGGPGAAPSWEREPEPLGHVVAPKLPRAGSGSPSRGDTWQPRSCPQSGGRSRCLDLKLVRGGTRSSGYRQWPPGPPRERMRTHVWGQHPFPTQPF
jgi:hypothetical protein